MELPRTSRVLQACYDHWLREAAPPPQTAAAVLQALRRALSERAPSEPLELESVGALLRRRVPGRMQARARAAAERPLQLQPLSADELLF